MSVDVDQLSRFFKALSDPTRLRILELLVRNRGALCVKALTAKLSVTQSAVSQHLRILGDIGVVRGRREGPRVHYVVDEEALAEYSNGIRDMFGVRLFS